MVRQRGKLGWCVALVCSWVALHATPAAAAEPPCETHTERDAAQIIVPLGDAEHPRLPAQAVKIVPGEALCVTGAIDEAGELRSLHLVTPDTESTAPIISLTLDRSDATRLTIRNSTASWLYYEALQLVTEQDVALPTSTAPVPPAQRNFEQWPHGARKLLLFGFRFGKAPATLTTVAGRVDERGRRRVRDTSGLNLSVTFGLWGGERQLLLGDLETALARDDYAPFRHVSFAGGLDLDFTAGRVRFGVGLGVAGHTTQQRGSGNELSARLSDVLFTLGWDLIRYEQLRVFLASGIGVGTLRVDHPEGASFFSDVRPWEGKRVQFTGWEVPLEVGTDYFWPFGRASVSERWLVQLGTRVGYVQQWGHGQWRTDEKDGRDVAGPNVDLSGWRARVVVGFGSQNGW